MKTISVILEANKTEVILTPRNGLEDDQKYEYRVTAINAIGNVTSHQDGIALCQFACLIVYVLMKYLSYSHI